MSSPFEDMLNETDAPGLGSSRRHSAARAKARRALGKAEPASTIQPGHELAFYRLRHDETASYGLVSCYVNGQPSALVVAAREASETTVEVMPLFVALTVGMRITSPDGDVIWDATPVKEAAA